MSRALFFQDFVAFENQNLAHTKWIREDRPIQYRHDGNIYTIAIERERDFSKNQVSLLVKWHLEHGELSQYKYVLESEGIHMIPGARVPVTWDKIILDGERVSYEPIRFRIPDQTSYKRDLIVFIALMCIAAYSLNRARNHFFPKKPVNPRKKIQRRI